MIFNPTNADSLAYSESSTVKFGYKLKTSSKQFLRDRML
jgi:hypothetical protein